MRFKRQADLTVWEMDRSKVIVVEKNDPQFDMVGCIVKVCDVNSRSSSSCPLITPAPVIAMWFSATELDLLQHISQELQITRIQSL